MTEHVGIPQRTPGRRAAQVSDGLVVYRERRLLSVSEAALLLGVSKTTIRRLIAEGALSAVRVRRLVRVQAEEIDQLIAGGGA